MLQAGEALLGAGCAVMGASTRLLLAGCGGTSQYTLDSSTGEFLLDRSLTAPPTVTAGQEVTVSSPTPHTVEEPFACVVQSLRRDNLVTHHHTGLAALDLYEVLVGGGLWISPPDLGLLYHGVPLAFIAEKAGGRVVPHILEILPNNIHQKVPLAVLMALDLDM